MAEEMFGCPTCGKCDCVCAERRHKAEVAQRIHDHGMELFEALKFQYVALTDLCNEWGMQLPGQVHGFLANLRDDARHMIDKATGDLYD